MGLRGIPLVKTGKYKDEKGKKKNITWKMLEEGMAAWRARFPGVAAFMDEVPQTARDNNGIITHVFGRERRFGDELWSPEDYVRARAEREAVNFLIQGPAAALTNRLINRIHAKIEGYILSGQLEVGDLHLVNTVHDSVGYEVRGFLADWFVGLLKAEAEAPVPQLGNHSFSMDIGVGPDWAESEIAAK